MNELRSRLHWLMGLRVTFVTLILGLSLIFEATKGERVETFYALIILTYSLTIPSALLLRTLSTSSALAAFFWTQVSIDFVLETVLVARTGGVESPFAVLYVITVAVASLIPHRRVGLFAACACIILFGVVTNVQFYGLTRELGVVADQSFDCGRDVSDFRRLCPGDSRGRVAERNTGGSAASS